MDPMGGVHVHKFITSRPILHQVKVYNAALLTSVVILVLHGNIMQGSELWLKGQVNLGSYH